ncbi:MAG TPA: delta-60 repeat domain-containing protein [Blastocatellia bacterium]|nr:delta-60 repeat domain-containing protein [Blastocatellia bacterium]
MANKKIICIALAVGLIGLSSAGSSFQRFEASAQNVSSQSAETAQAAGDLDSTFGQQGKITTDFFGSDDGAGAVALQNDGKIVVAGNATSASTGLDFALARYNADGSLDLGFGSQGKVTTDFFGNTDLASSVAIQPDGKILAGGNAKTSFINTDFALARYNSDGSLDPTFGSGGKVTTDFFGGVDEVFAIALQSNGKIVLAGHANMVNASGGDFALARYNSDGTLDATFNNTGKVTTDFFGDSDAAFDVAIDTNGRIVAAGQAVAAGTGSDFAVVRYNADGSLDSTFNHTGKVTTDFSGAYDEALAMRIQSDGRIVAAGWTSRGQDFSFHPSDDFALVRYNVDGSLDTSFGANGKVQTDFHSGTDRIVDLAIQTDGKLVGAGLTIGPSGDSSTTMDFGLARYNSDGSLDATFGAQGLVTTDFFHDTDKAIAVAIQKDGNIVAVGSAVHPPFGSDFALARYIGGSPASMPDFSLSAPATITGQPATKVSAMVSINRVGGFTGNVTVSPPPSVPGIKIPQTPLSTTGDSAAFRIKVKGSAKPGSHDLTFTGRDDTGALVHTVTVTLVVQ